MHMRRRNRLTVSNGLGRVDVSTTSTTGIVGSVNFDHGLLGGFVLDDPGLEKDMKCNGCAKILLGKCVIKL